MNNIKSTDFSKFDKDILEIYNNNSDVVKNNIYNKQRLKNLADHLYKRYELKYESNSVEIDNNNKNFYVNIKLKDNKILTLKCFVYHVFQERVYETELNNSCSGKFNFSELLKSITNIIANNISFPEQATDK